MKKIFLFLVLIMFAHSAAFAHFGLIIPSKSMVMEKKDANISFDIAFSHPFAVQGMAMQKPDKVIAEAAGITENLTEILKPAKFMDKPAWQAEYTLKRPGTYQFAVIPKPYFEQAEDCFIVHYAKTAIGAFGSEDGWDEPMGLPIEIVPLIRPFGNYAGNIFQGIVLYNGKPLANATVEVEFLNNRQEYVAPAPYFETQVIKTDSNGVFSFGIPWAGWWGFAALATAPEKMLLDGKEKNVELGAVYWSEFFAPERRK